jgi:allophycocyanin-B
VVSLKAFEEFLSTGERRMQIAETLSENEKKIVDRASGELWRRRPDFIAPGGNAFGQKQRALCLRDYGWYLRLVTYSLIAGDKEPIEDIGLIGVREMYNALDVPVPGMAEAVRCLKEASLGLLSDEDAQEAQPYFDYIIQAMS